MGSQTLPVRADTQTINENWFNVFRNALMQDQVPRNSSGVATDQAGSLGTSSLRFLNAYLMNQFLMTGSNYTKMLRASGGSDHDLTWPNALPGSTLPIQVSAAGILTFAQLPTGGIADLAVTQAKLAARATGSTVAAGGVATSSSSGTFTTTSTSAVDVTNLSVTITTTGRPVRIQLISSAEAATSVVGVTNGSGSSAAEGRFLLYRDAVLISRDGLRIQIGSGGTSPTIQVPPANFSCVDIVSAGTYTYKLQALTTTTNDTITVRNVILSAFET